MPDRELDIFGETSVETEQDLKEPPLFRVVLLNDDYTTMEFVVAILERVFRKSSAEAHKIMLCVHLNGEGIAGVYPREVAETKVGLVHQYARESEFPLRCRMEPE